MKRADVDRTVDEALVFYHATDEPLPIGAEVYSWGSGGHTPYVVDSERPDDMFNDRNAHLFMVKDPACLDWLGQESENMYVYRVTPTERVTRANFQWLREARDLDLAGLEPKARAAARNYWGGVPGVWPCFDEYLTMAFKVEELV